MSYVVRYTIPGGETRFRRLLWVILRDFEEAHCPAPEDSTRETNPDVCTLPLEDETGFAVTSFAGKSLLENLPAAYENFVKGEITQTP